MFLLLNWNSLLGWVTYITNDGTKTYLQSITQISLVTIKIASTRKLYGEVKSHWQKKKTTFIRIRLGTVTFLISNNYFLHLSFSDSVFLSMNFALCRNRRILSLLNFSDVFREYRNVTLGEYGLRWRFKLKVPSEITDMIVNTPLEVK